MKKRVHRVMVPSVDGMEAGSVALYNTTTGAINLANGELGLYNADTLVSIDPATGVTTEKKVFFAIGRDTTGNGTVDTIERSLDIEVAKVTDTQTVDYSAPANQIQVLTWSNTDCETEYCLKFNFNSVRISEDLGFNPLYKTFSHTTDCCDNTCDTCGGGDCAALATDFVELINDDIDGLVTATAQALNDLAFTAEDVSSITTTLTIVAGGQTLTYTIAGGYADSQVGADALLVEIFAALDSFNIPYNATTSSITHNGVGDADLDLQDVYATSLTFSDGATGIVTTATADATGCSGIFLELNPYAIADWCNLPRNYAEPLGITAEVFGLCGWNCNSTISVVQDMAYEIGSGESVKFAEGEASGYTQNLYRYTSLPTTPDFERTLYADATATYDAFVIEHIDTHEGAPSGHFFDSVLQTIIACDATLTTLNTDLDVVIGTL